MRLPPVQGGRFRPHLRISRFRVRTSAGALDMAVKRPPPTIYGDIEGFIKLLMQHGATAIESLENMDKMDNFSRKHRLYGQKSA